jgi:E3 SUMO-protein ligase PIAS1
MQLVRYFDEIIKNTPESVEDVIVEANAEWHTADGKYGSERWKASHPPSTSVQPPTVRKPSPEKTPPQSQSKLTTDGEGSLKEDNPEIVVLDSDDEDEGRVKRELSPSFRGGSSVSVNQSPESQTVPQSQSQDNVIDLTLDSDDDEPPPPRRAEKRKANEPAMSPTEQIWKKGRQDQEPTPAVPVANGHVATLTSSGNYDANANANAYSQYSHSRHHSNPIPRTTHNLSPPAQYTSPFLTSTFLPSPRMTASGGSPLIRSSYAPRVNPRWPGA